MAIGCSLLMLLMVINGYCGYSINGYCGYSINGYSWLIY